MSLLLASLLTIEFIGPCSPKPLLQTTASVNSAADVGALTIMTLRSRGIPFAGTERGLNSAFETPIGDGALEVISDTEMRSYGWCYQVDGLVPEVFPDDYLLDQGMRRITWFFGFAHYKHGQWVSQCEPAYNIKPKFLCK